MFQIFPKNAEPTFVDAGTTIDYFALSPELYVRDFKLLGIMLCQHVPLALEVLFDLDDVATVLPCREPNLLFPTDRLLMTRDVLRLLTSVGSLPSTVNELYNKIESAFLSCGLLKKVRCEFTASESWWRLVPGDIRRKLETLETVSVHRTRAWVAREVDAPSIEELIDMRREYAEVCTAARRAADINLQQQMMDCFPDPSLCWKVIRKIRNPSSAVAIDVGTLQAHFTRIFHKRDRPVVLTSGPDTGTDTGHHNQLNLPFTDQEMKTALKELNGSAAVGPERIPSQALKEVFKDDNARSLLLVLMNRCWSDGVIPQPWGQSELFILYKGKGLRTLSDNYRAIALSNDFRRVFERLVGARLAKWSALTEATGRMQFGFKKGVSTLDAIFVVRAFLFFSTRVLKRPGVAMFVDLRKAFPSMSRPKIISSLSELGVPVKIRQALAALMSGTTSRLRVNNRLSDPITVTSGTPEGSINSPELFSIVYKVVLDRLGIEELPSDLSKIDPKKVYYVIYADDLTFLSLDTVALKNTANEFAKECEEFDLEVNRPKTKWMVFLPTGHETRVELDLEMSILGERIENVDIFTYLGFDLDCELTDKGHVQKLNKRLQQSARATGQILKDMKCADLASLRKYFVTLVMSQLYGSIFIDDSRLEVDKAAGIFFKTAVSLPQSFLHVLCAIFLGVHDVRKVVFEQRLRFLMKVEARPNTPVFSALLVDRCMLMSLGVGLNARLAVTLNSLDVLPTIDYREQYSCLRQALELKIVREHASVLLSAEGRAFWTELLSDGMFPKDLANVVSSLHYEQARIMFLFLADGLRWSAMTCVQDCVSCKTPFTTAHFFLCDRPFLSGQEWSILMSLCQQGAWLDMIDLVFKTLKLWATQTSLFKPLFILHVLEYQ